MNANPFVVAIRKGESQMRDVLFTALQVGDIFYVNGIPHTVGSDAHRSGDISYNGCLLYDDLGNSWFPEDLDVSKHTNDSSECINLNFLFQSICNALPNLPGNESFCSNGSLILCRNENHASVIADFLEAMGCDPITGDYAPSEDDYEYDDRFAGWYFVDIT